MHWKENQWMPALRTGSWWPTPASCPLSPTWSQYGEVLTEKYIVRAVQVMQNKAARCVTKESWFTSTRSLLRQCNWLSIEQLIVFHTALQVWRVRSNKCPAYIDSKFQLSRTRSSDQDNCTSSTDLSCKQVLNGKSCRSVEPDPYWDKTEHISGEF